MKKLSLLIVFLLGITAVYGQDFLKKSKVSGSFQIDGNYYWEDEGIGITQEDINGNKFGGYGFGKVQYQLGNFTAGIRFESYQIFKMTGLPTELNGMGLANYFATYDNGTSKLLGQIAVANFANPSGLEKIGDNLYQSTPNSGEFDGIGEDITAGSGSLSTGVLEMSNVDLSAEFTDMITTQRGFQANSRIITVSDSMLEELTNLKR